MPITAKRSTQSSVTPSNVEQSSGESTFDVSIQLADQTHLPYLVNAILSLQHHESSEIADLDPNIEKNLTSWVKQLLTNQNALTLVAVDHKQQPLGCLLGEIQLSGEGIVANPLIGKVMILWVEPERRKHQLGKQLLSFFEQSCLDAGVKNVECQHTYDNALADGFWLAQGYHPISVSRRKMLE